MLEEWANWKPQMFLGHCFEGTHTTSVVSIDLSVEDEVQ